MLSIHLRLGLPSGLFPSGFPTNNLSVLSKSLRSLTAVLDHLRTGEGLLGLSIKKNQQSSAFNSEVSSFHHDSLNSASDILENFLGWCGAESTWYVVH
jgi:hypothetical protein